VVGSLAIGVGVGVALATLAFLGPALAGTTYVPGLGPPAAPVVPWGLITIVVASAEEGVLRGVLFDRVQRLAGLAPAIALTTIVFALLHVPLYGWHVVPLDLAVGLVLAGLRVGTRGLVAPAAAHVVADLATWWL
jgi:membrane protease YdiL (CAAX protease family)